MCPALDPRRSAELRSGVQAESGPNNKKHQLTLALENIAFPALRPIRKSTGAGGLRIPTPTANRVTFNRLELNRILNLYGRMVADGEWRDYAIDFLRDRAVFSVYRRASEVPLYRIEKDPRLARKQGMYSVISATGLILRRGHELDRVLLAIDRKPALV